MADGSGVVVGRPGAAAPGGSVYSEAGGAAIAARVAGGESVARICREPGQPHRTTVGNWRDAHPAFDVAMRAAFRARRLAERMADREAAAALSARPPPKRGGRASTYTPE